MSKAVDECGKRAVALDPVASTAPVLAALVADCKHWKRGKFRFVSVPLAGSCVVDWLADAPIFARWIRGKAHAKGFHASDAEIADAIGALLADADREIAPPGTCKADAGGASN